MWLHCRVENLEKFKSDDGDCPTLVCTDLAARGLDLDVDHVIMFDFPLNSVSMRFVWFITLHFFLSHFHTCFLLQVKPNPYCIWLSQIDYLHRTGRTARMGAKGKCLLDS